MQRYVNSTIDVILDRTADELIGGVLVALLLSLALAGAFALLRRKISDATTLITCLALAANLAGMTLAAGFVRGEGRQGMRLNPGFRPGVPPPAVVGDRGASLARAIFARADADGDGLLSPEEAAGAAERFVKRAEAIEGGALNEGLLRSALRRHMLTPPEMVAPMPPYDPARVGSESPGPAATSAPGPAAGPPRPGP
jgi:hypothetical protein